MISIIRIIFIFLILESCSVASSFASNASTANPLSNDASANSCQASEDTLVGNWKRVKNGFFEEMNFSVTDGKKEFSSWLQMRPEMSGTWNLSKCNIQIQNGTDDRMQFSWKIQKITKSKIYALDIESGENLIYKKIP